MNKSLKASLSLLTFFFQIVVLCLAIPLGFAKFVLILPALVLTAVLVFDAFFDFLKKSGIKAAVMLLSMFFVIVAYFVSATFGVVYTVFTVLATALSVVYFVLYIRSLVSKKE